MESGKKRKRGGGGYENPEDQYTDYAQVLDSTLGVHPEDAISFHLDPPPSNSRDSHDQDGDWTYVSSKKRKSKKHSAAAQRHSSKNAKSDYLSISHSPNVRLSQEVKIADLQALVLYLLADGTAPSWVAVNNRRGVRKVVVLMVPGLEMGMFDGSVALDDGPCDDDNVTKHDDTTDELSELALSRLKSNGEATGSSVGTQSTSHDRNLSSFKRRKPISPDDYYPVSLDSQNLPRVLQPLSAQFDRLWPIKAPGEDRTSRIHSPMQAILTTPITKSHRNTRDSGDRPKGPQPPAYSNGWQDQSTHVSAFIASLPQLLDDDYVIHPSMFENDDERSANQSKRKTNHQTEAEGWVASSHGGSLPFQHQDKVRKDEVFDSVKVLALDCEMCTTSDGGPSLTRVSVLSVSGKVLLDELVKPKLPIIDYLTAYSGITEAKLSGVTTTLADVQGRLLDLLTDSTILVGHSLVSDLNALKLTHPHIIDTSMIYPHPRGPPFKSSLKFLAQRYLKREIQTQVGKGGHDPTQDALAALDLVRQKCERGPEWGTSEANGESIFKRLARSRRPPASRSEAADTGVKGACVDWGDPSRGYGAGADVCIGCQSDKEVEEGVIKAIKGDDDGSKIPGGGVDFIWARMRELEVARGWNNRPPGNMNKGAEDEADAAARAASGAEPSKRRIVTGAVHETVKHIQNVYRSLPPCTAFIIYSGTGDPRELTRLHTKHKKYREAFKTTKWDDLGDLQWMDADEQALKTECRRARRGLGLICVR
ncbi:MAG: hypothetical protein M1828_006301 [Chrysothrix sp. TS-e1954]|nr:MAG: hypothetical protein M1828_006301 [Chrysothrix sp. TS-e1954]